MRAFGRPWKASIRATILPAFGLSSMSAREETQGPFATLWVGLGLGCFYIALIWLNTLLGFLLTPLFIIPATWLMDRLGPRRAESNS